MMVTRDTMLPQLLHAAIICDIDYASADADAAIFAADAATLFAVPLPPPWMLITLFID